MSPGGLGYFDIVALKRLFGGGRERGLGALVRKKTIWGDGGVGLLDEAAI